MKAGRHLVPWFSILVCIGLPCGHSAPNKPPGALEKHLELKVPDGKLTLTTSPAENGAANLFLTNTTQNVVEGEMFGLMPRFKEVRIEGQWRRCWSFEPTKCAEDTLGNVGPDLPSGHATLLETIDWNAGDTEGLVRYCQPMFLGPPLVTESRKGRFNQADLEKASRDFYSYQGISVELVTCLLHGKIREGNIFRNVGELAATLELERAYDQSGLPRSVVERWLEKNPKGFATTSAAEMKALHEVLARPWDQLSDESNCLKVCLDALAQAGKGKHPVGSPARYPAVVWSYLGARQARHGDKWNLAGVELANPERWEALQQLTATGNPLGIGRPELARIIPLAEKSSQSKDPREVQAAKAFLQSVVVLPGG